MSLAMTGISLSFFWTPPETLGWLKDVVSEFRLWVVLMVPGRDDELVHVDEIPIDIFYGRSEESLHFLLGSNEIASEPVWRQVHGRQLLDFARSYAIQLVAPVVAPDRETLLEGRLATLHANQYGDQARARRLLKLFRVLRTRLKKESDDQRTIVQELPNGKKKRWTDIALGKRTPSPDIKRLKQFLEGEVVFQIEAS